MAKEQMTEDIIMEKKDIGEVKIASDVVSVIAALAATEVEGVNSMAGMNKFGVKNTKGVRVLMNEGRVHVGVLIKCSPLPSLLQKITTNLTTPDFYFCFHSIVYSFSPVSSSKSSH